MENNSAERVEEIPLRPGTWVDLFLYFFVIVIFFGASLLVSFVFNVGEITFLLTVVSVLLNILIIGGGAYLVGVRRKKISWASLGISPPKWQPIYLLWAFLAVVILIPIRGGIGGVVEWLIKGNLDSLEMRGELLSAGSDTWYGFLFMLAGVGVAAPIAEELFFRGLLYDWIRQRVSVPWSVVISSLLFALAHPDSIAVMTSAFIMALVLAAAYEHTKSLWLSIAMHVITNSMSVFMIYVFSLLGQILQDSGYM